MNYNKHIQKIKNFKIFKRLKKNKLKVKENFSSVLNLSTQKVLFVYSSKKYLPTFIYVLC